MEALNLDRNEEDKIKRDIYKGKNHEFCIAYKFFLHEKMQKQCKDMNKKIE